MAEIPKTSVTLLKALAGDSASSRWAEFCRVHEEPMHGSLRRADNGEPNRHQFQRNDHERRNVAVIEEIPPTYRTHEFRRRGVSVIGRLLRRTPDDHAPDVRRFFGETFARQLSQREDVTANGRLAFQQLFRCGIVDHSHTNGMPIHPRKQRGRRRLAVASLNPFDEPEINQHRHPVAATTHIAWLEPPAPR